MLTQSHTNIKKLGSIANLLHCTVWSIHDHPRLFHRKSDEHTSPNRDMQMFQLCSTHALKGFKNKSPVPRRVEAGPESACGQGSSRSNTCARSSCPHIAAGPAIQSPSAWLPQEKGWLDLHRIDGLPVFCHLPLERFWQLSFRVRIHFVEAFSFQ